MEYLIILIVTIYCAYGNHKMSNSLRLTLLGGLYCAIVLILGLRYRVGIDTINYSTSYQWIPAIETLNFEDIFATEREPGYYLLSCICKSFNDEFWLVQLTVAIITNIGVFVFLKKHCINPFIGLLIYYLFAIFYFNVEIIREGAAVGIFLLNFNNLEKKRWVRYYLISLLSISFHYSAFIIWLFPFARFLKLNIWFIAFCCIAFAIAPLVEGINSLISFASINNRMNTYIGGNDLNYNWRILQVIQNAVPAMFALFLMRKRQNEYQSLRPFVLLQIIMVAAAFAIPIIFQRFINYTQIITIAYIANVLCMGTFKPFLKTAFISIILLSQVYNWQGMWVRWIPYVSIFNPEKIEARELRWSNEFGK